MSARKSDIRRGSFALGKLVDVAVHQIRQRLLNWGIRVRVIQMAVRKAPKTPSTGQTFRSHWTTVQQVGDRTDTLASICPRNCYVLLWCERAADSTHSMMALRCAAL